MRLSAKAFYFASAFCAAALAATGGIAQAPPAGGGAPAGRQAQGAPKQWWVEKTVGGVYHAPMRPLWKLADLKRMHPGQNNWQQQIIKDPEQDATYNSAAPGSKFGARIHPDTESVFVVLAGQVKFDVEGQPSATAKRGSIVHIMKNTVHSYEAVGTENALWVEVNPNNYKTLYPVNDPAPKATSGGQVIKVAFNNTPAPYTGPNQLHWNLFDALAACTPMGTKAIGDHIFASPLLGYVNPADNKCPGGRGNVGNTPLPGAPALPPFNPKSTFGHMHAGPAEWWIVQVGKISGKFENQGEFIAEEGDVLYAAPMMWHQMSALAPSGPSVRLAMGGYQLINMNNTAGGGD